MSSSHLGSGGMRSKVLCAEMATSAGIPVVICNGTEPGTLLRAVAGEPVGTRFHPQARRAVELQAVAEVREGARGTVLVDPGAERALREQGTSLLPVGVVEVEGDFEAGDAVDVAAAADGRRPIGKGISNYSAAELRRVKGLKSDRGARAAAARERGGRAPRLLRAGLSGQRPATLFPMAVQDQVRRGALRPGEGGLARAGDARRRDEGRGAARRSPTSSRRAWTRSSRRTPATSRTGAPPASTPRCSTGSR